MNLVCVSGFRTCFWGKEAKEGGFGNGSNYLAGEGKKHQRRTNLPAYEVLFGINETLCAPVV
jgi:hypothetical protein